MAKKNEPIAMFYCKSYWKLVNGHFVTIENDGKLFSMDRNFVHHRTNYTEDDIKDNPNYLHGRWQKRWGWLSLKGVRQMKYNPNMWINHLFRDDGLYISYRESPLIEYKTTELGRWISGYDMILDGWDMIDFIDKCDYPNKALIQDLIQYKIVYYKQKFPNEDYTELADLPWLKNKYPYEILDIDQSCRKNMNDFINKFSR